MNRVLHAIALLLLATASAEAQEVAGTFHQLRVLVKAGDTLTLTDATGQRLRGKLAELSASSLVLEIAGARRLFQDNDVAIIEKRGADSLKNGALIGLAIGGGLFGPAIGAATGDWGFAVVGGLIYAGIGAGIGVGVDALIEGSRVIYAGAPSRRTTFSIAPILGRSRRGVLLSFPM